MIKIGLAGGAKKYHGMTFSEMLNGYDRKKAEEKKWAALYSARLGDDVRVTHIWDENPSEAREAAEICGIDSIVKKPEDLTGAVDAVIIPDDCTLAHQKRALPFLRAGMPVFIDKPLSADIKEAERIIGLAQKHKAPLMSCSCLRYAKEIQESNLEEIGEIQTGWSISRSDMGNLFFYGIHAFELLYSIVGPGVKSVRNIGNSNKENILDVTFSSGKKFIVCAYESISGLFQVNLYGSKGHRSITVTDFNHAYSETLRNFISMVKTGNPPVPIGETFEILKSLHKANQQGALL
jgi:predicted dehydrogenase